MLLLFLGATQQLLGLMQPRPSVRVLLMLRATAQMWCWCCLLL
jgi:hypothetical protein